MKFKMVFKIYYLKIKKIRKFEVTCLEVNKLSAEKNFPTLLQTTVKH